VKEDPPEDPPGNLKAESRTKPKRKALNRKIFYDALWAGHVRAIFSQDTFPALEQGIVSTVWDGTWQFGLKQDQTSRMYTACARKLEALEYKKRLHPVSHSTLLDLHTGRARLLSNDHISYYVSMNRVAPQADLPSQSGRPTPHASSFVSRQFTGSQPTPAPAGFSSTFGGGTDSFAVGLRTPVQPQPAALPQRPAPSGARVPTAAAPAAATTAAPAAPVAPPSGMERPMGMSPP
jgi:hypothetical protein